MFTDQPFNYFRAIATSDTVDLPDGESDAIYVGGAGVVVAVRKDGTTVNFTAVAGGILPIKAKRVNATSTTATLLVALYRK
jgi:hypothetical protein